MALGLRLGLGFIFYIYSGLFPPNLLHSCRAYCYLTGGV